MWPLSSSVSGQTNTMRLSVKLWLALIAAPVLLWLSMFVLGLVGLAGLWGYYSPLWFLGDPFFLYSSDTGWYYPTWAGAAVTAVVYSVVFWIGVYVWGSLQRARSAANSSCMDSPVNR